MSLGMKSWTKSVQPCIKRSRSVNFQWSYFRDFQRPQNQLRCFSRPAPLGKAGMRRALQVRVSDLPQGMIPLEPASEESSATGGTYKSVLHQARNNMQKFAPCVLLTRVGNFYELYFEQAEEYGPLLNLKVAMRKTSSEPVAMAGFPFYQLDRFLKILVQDHAKHVAISEEILLDPSRRAKFGGLLFDRQVRRIVTPGTLIDEQFLSPFKHNYLLCLHLEHIDLSSTGSADNSKIGDRDISIGMAWMDLSSGDFFTQSTTLALLSSIIARIGPREIVIGGKLGDAQGPTLDSLIEEEGRLITYYEPPLEALEADEWSSIMEEASIKSGFSFFPREETLSASLLVQYVKKQLPGLTFRLQAPIRRHADEYMSIDKNTLKGLEIVETLKDGAYKGSLLQVIRRTSTESGARLLSQRLTSPSMSLSVINKRLDLVETFLKNESLLEETVSLLRRTYDTLRLVQKFSFGRGDSDDLIGLSKTIQITEQVGHGLKTAKPAEHECISDLLDRFEWEAPRKLATRISDAIDQESLGIQQRNAEVEAAAVAGMAREVLENNSATEEMSTLNAQLNSKRFSKTNGKEDEKVPEDEVWIMRRIASPALKKLHQSLDELKEEKVRLGQQLKETLNAQSLTLKMTPGLGHICHVKGKDTKIDLSGLENTRTVGSSKSTRSFYLPEWTSLGNRLEDVKWRIRTEEQRIFQILREQVVRNLVVLRRNAMVLDELDVACSFARLAQEHRLTRPSLNHECKHRIWGGRHLTVETGLVASGRTFVPNNCTLEENERIWLITGPNMAGKSTFLRQTALISILAQTGSFVPADYAEIGLVDHIFSRIGSADNLFQNQSTFMVEMLETSHILRNATERSFVVMDEVGRGTTPEDGIAIGYALLHQLHNIIKCRTLFATHFHALADMTRDFNHLACYCTNVVEEEDEGSFRYDHTLQRGVNRESHALKVAKLAGMPDETIKLAEKVLRGLKFAKDEDHAV